MKVNMYRWKVQRLSRNKEMLERRMDALVAKEYILHNKFEESIIAWSGGPHLIKKFEHYLTFLESGIMEK